MLRVELLRPTKVSILGVTSVDNTTIDLYKSLIINIVRITGLVDAIIRDYVQYKQKAQKLTESPNKI